MLARRERKVGKQVKMELFFGAAKLEAVLQAAACKGEL
jgi:hypothetical protein